MVLPVHKPAKQLHLPVHKPAKQLHLPVQKPAKQNGFASAQACQANGVWHCLKMTLSFAHYIELALAAFALSCGVHVRQPSTYHTHGSLFIVIHVGALQVGTPVALVVHGVHGRVVEYGWLVRGVGAGVLQAVVGSPHGTAMMRNYLWGRNITFLIWLLQAKHCKIDCCY